MIYDNIRINYRERVRYQEASALYRFIRHSSVVYMPDMDEGPSK